MKYVIKHLEAELKAEEKLDKIYSTQHLEIISSEFAEIVKQYKKAISILKIIDFFSLKR